MQHVFNATNDHKWIRQIQSMIISLSNLACYTHGKWTRIGSKAPNCPMCIVTQLLY